MVEPNPFLDTPRVLEIRRDFMFFSPATCLVCQHTEQSPTTAAACRFDRGVQNVKPCCASNNAT